VPGIFGASAVGEDVARRLEVACREALGDLATHRSAAGVLGGRGYDGLPALRQTADGWLAVDGDRAGYAVVETGARGGARLTPPSFRGVRAWMGDAGPELRIAADWLNGAPLYYAARDGGVAFASRLRPLALALGSAADPVGAMQYLREGAHPTARTPFAGIRRLLPGQTLHFVPGRPPRIEEDSRLWRPSRRPPDGGGDAAGEAWARLLDAVAPLGAAGRPALMLSAGWDSRTLLAALRAAGIRQVLGYTHGHPRAREIRLAERLARRAGIELEVAPLGPELVRPAFLDEVFPGTECLVFPHWAAAGRRLAEAGAGVVLAGVLGEVLGGHYGTTMVRSGPGRFADLARRLAGAGAGAGGAADATELLLPDMPQLPWYATPDAWPRAGELAAGLRGDVEAALDRLRGRGVPEDDALVEAYVTETRGCQYICAQLESIRAALPVAAPFGDRRLAALATALPLDARIHNRITREILERHAPDLLRLPLAATLAPAGSPLALQEASRLVRWGVEQLHWKAFRATRGRVPQPRWGWVDFSFLRTGVLTPLIESLQADLWDRPALRRTAHWLEGDAGLRNVHPWFDQLGKILTIDHLLR
jgi:hypothetical protein